MQVNVIDFGLAKKYRDPKTHIHIPYRYKSKAWMQSCLSCADCRITVACTGRRLTGKQIRSPPEMWAEVSHTCKVSYVMRISPGLQREQEPDGDGAVREHQHAPGHRAEPARRHRVAGLRADVLPARQLALAGAQGGHEEAEVREDQREEDEHAHRGGVWSCTVVLHCEMG